MSQGCEPGWTRALANVTADTQGLKEVQQGFMSVLLPRTPEYSTDVGWQA